MAEKKIGIGRRVAYFLAGEPQPVGGRLLGSIMEALDLHLGTDCSRRIRECRPKFDVRCDPDTYKYSITSEERARIRETDGFKKWKRSQR